MATPKKTEPEAPAGATAFRDTVFTSRTLILPDGRSLPVAQNRVIAGPGDTIALEYLQGHPDLQQE
ncbi:hypothetical protein [Pseudomonas aegrilactucae]|uniref:Uncharacterized protein n=1 Tax=Pseudomonas aegrilactucae TaxID=2854028 RepID=A0A9Q2XI87_9PSED|nr:hypothetical protein [Pseudomonas aegrilactucae]MBV6287491.1 hypothetical protein [Pseudomonas aegrilactucae]